MESMTRQVVRFTIPEVPPSVNHYKKPIKIRTSNGICTSFALTPEAEAFQMLTKLYCRGASLIPPGLDPVTLNTELRDTRYSLHATVYLGPKQRGDGDNFWKCIADSLVLAGVIHSDARVRRWYMEVIDTDRKNPRTELRAAIIRRPAACPKPAKQSKPRKDCAQPLTRTS